MLRITIEVVPYGDDRLATVIGRGSIGNISALADLADYSCSFTEGSWNHRVHGPYSGMLTGWSRSSHGAWETVHAALTIALETGSARQGISV